MNTNTPLPLHKPFHPLDKHTPKKDFLLIVIILSISALSFLANRIFSSAPALRAEVSVDGQAVHTLILNQDGEVLVQGFAGGFNRIIIESGTVFVSEASCPDKICVHQGKVSHTGETIVCLPNRVTVVVIGE